MGDGTRVQVIAKPRKGIVATDKVPQCTRTGRAGKNRTCLPPVNEVHGMVSLCICKVNISVGVMFRPPARAPLQLYDIDPAIR